jgi:eukaryotic-like serine/threonine-protein kinase
MGIQVGQRLGPYEILSAIGAGGMGEVYRARDTRLDRIVAVKILPDHCSDRAELRERFEREARTIASLNHPHICTLYDIGRQDGTDYLVMEYLEGETLSERLKKGPLPLEQVLKNAIELADALDKAHRKGITHRDLKPGNVMLTKSGTKLLDFGLAKLRQEAAPNIALSKLPTANEAITAQGTIVGTLQYMAPEQLEGRDADARTDIFAFGVVVYEMATGEKAFEGKSSASVIGAILKDNPPPMSSVQPMIPPALDRVVKKCLAKEPEKRWQVASDLCDELKWIAEGGSQATLAPAVAPKGIRALGRRPLILSLGSLLIGLAIAGLATWNLKPTSASPPRAITRTVINLPPGDRLAGFDQPAVAISPDGSHLAYVAIRGSTQQLFLRGMDSLEAKPIPGTEDAANPFFSADSQWLGLSAGGKLKKVPVAGGPAVTLGDVSTARGATWSSQGGIIFVPSTVSILQQIPEAGGAPRPVTHFEKGEPTHRWPEFLPDGKSLFFAGGPSTGNWATAKIAVQSLRTGERRDLLQGGTNPRYALSGHLLYAQAGTVMAAPFNDQRLQLTGASVPVLEDVLQFPGTGAAQYSISATGSLVYISGSVRALSRKLVWVSRNGVEQSIAAPPRVYYYPRLSPDGRRIAVEVVEQEQLLWLYDFARDTLSPLTFEVGNIQNEVWTPDGRRVAFATSKDGPINIFWQPSDGSGGLERLTTSENAQFPISFSPDGQLLAFTELNPNTGMDIWMLRLKDRKAEPFIQAPSNQTAPSFSPNGRWLAYSSDESGRPEIYVQPYPGPVGRWQVSTEGGQEPVWNPNGRELFYRSGYKMMAVDIETQPSFSAGKPKMLFSSGLYLLGLNGLHFFDVSPDGQRFLMIKQSEEAAALTQIVVVQNWFEELKRRVPTEKK